jgi:HTH-type transcriptional regulator, transcriptional repressor of NAD biosynthesis genes
MSDRFHRGLVVGKFWPLHRGHQVLIDRALALCDEVVVISYTKPEHERFSPAVRDHWLAMLYPSVIRLVVDDQTLLRACRSKSIEPRTLPRNDDADDAHRDFIGWLCTALLGVTIDAVFTSESYGDGLAAALAARFGADVRHVCVDRTRAVMPVSGRQIRADLFRSRDFVDPRVYADLVPRVGVVGGESSGKTTLARALADRLGTVWAEEYGRELWERRRGDLRFDDMLEIGREQVAREQRLAQDAQNWLICDTTPLTTCFYSQDLFGRVDPELDRLASRGYDLIVLCAPDFAFVQDGTRRDAAFREAQHLWHADQLRHKQFRSIVVAGSVADRVEAALSNLPSL